MKTSIPAHELWRISYRSSRYARHLSSDELNKRIRYILLNFLALNEDDKIAPVPLESGGDVWVVKWAHMLEEMELRYGPYPAGFSKEIFKNPDLPNYASELATKASHAVKNMKASGGNFLAKYGKRKYVEDLYYKGAIRIRPATYYSYDFHNDAVKDDELNFGSSFALNRDDVIKIVTNPKDVPLDIDVQRIDFNYKIEGDYWLYCLSSSLEPRLFVDFEANACVLIKDKISFLNRISAAFASNGLACSEKKGDVVYIDPLLPSKGIPNIPLTKNFYYSYQKEYRIVWLPDNKRKLEEFVDIRIGSIEDIAEIIYL